MNREKTVLTEEETKILDGFKQIADLFQWSQEGMEQLGSAIEKWDPELTRLRISAVYFRISDLMTAAQALLKYIELTKVDWRPRTDN